MNEKYLMDYSLFRVAKQLRLLGLDVICESHINHAQILYLSATQHRIIITSSHRFVPQIERIQKEEIQEWKQETMGASSCGNVVENNAEKEETAAESNEKQNINNLCAVAQKQLKIPTVGEYFPVQENRRKKERQMAQNVKNKKETGEKGKQGERAENRKKVLVGYNSEGESEYGEDGDSSLQSDHCSSGSEEGEEEPWRILRYIYVNPYDTFQRQLHSVIKRMGIVWDPALIFTRCVACNTNIEDVDDKETIRDLVHDTVFRVYEQFYQCPTCCRVYWGMEDGVLVNFKALRTVEYLRHICAQAHGISTSNVPDTTTSGLHQGGHPKDEKAGEGEFGSANIGMQPMKKLKIHIAAYPRVVKCTILSYLDTKSLDSMCFAFPMFAELAGVVVQGLDYKFVPETTAERKARRSKQINRRKK